MLFAGCVVPSRLRVLFRTLAVLVLGLIAAGLHVFVASDSGTLSPAEAVAVSAVDPHDESRTTTCPGSFRPNSFDA